MVEKGPLGQLDAVWEGKSVPVLTKEENSAVSIALLRSRVQALSVDEHSSEAILNIASRAVRMSQETASDSPAEELLQYRPKTGEGTDIDDRESFDALVQDVRTLSKSFLFMVLLPATVLGRRIIVKYETVRPKGVSHSSRLTGVSKVTHKRLVSWPAASFHSEILLSQEVIAADVVACAREPYKDDHVPQDQLFSVPVDAGDDRLHFVASAGQAQNRTYLAEIIATVVPAKQGIRSFSAWATAAVATLLGLAWVARCSENLIAEPFGVPSPALSLLLVGPALFLSWIARSREHQVVTATVRPLRQILIFNALALMSMGVLVAVPLTTLMWNIGWIICSALVVVALAWRLWISYAYKNATQAASA